MKDYKGYTRVNTTCKIKNDANYMLERSLNGYTYTECLISPNGDESKKFLTHIQVFQKYDADGEAVKIIGRIGEIERGNYIMYDNQTWLVVTKPEDNGTYRKAEARLCPTSLPIKDNDKTVIVGFDEFERPIEEVIEGQVVLLPCVPKPNDASVSIADINEPINELANIITVTIPYRESPSIQYDKRLSLYKDSYRIIRIDESKSINGIGILKITGERMGIGGK